MARGPLRRIVAAGAVIVAAATAAVMVPWRTDGPVAAGFRQLLDLDLTTPSVQPLYRTRDEVNAVTGRTFSEWCVFDQSSGNPACDGGLTLTWGAGTAYPRQFWPGFDGDDMLTGYRAWEFAGTSSTPEAFAAASNGTYDFTQSLVVIVQARLARAPAANRSIVSKWANDTTAGGYRIYVTSGGAATAQVRGSAATVTISGLGVGDALSGLANGAPQWLALQLNATTGFGTFYTHRTAGTPVALPAGAVAASATPFRVGGAPTLFSCEGLQILTVGVLLGAEAEAFDVGDLNALDNWMRPPATFGSSYVRASVQAPEIGTDALGVRVQHVAGTATRPELTHFAHVSMAAMTRSPWKLGSLSEQGAANSADGVTINLAKRNRVLNSDDLASASWTRTNATATARAGESPAGFRDAASLTCSAADCTAHQNFTGEINEPHTLSCYLRRNGGADVTGRLIAYRTDTSAEVSSTAFTAGGTWARVTHAATAPAAALRLILEIDANGASVYVWGCQAEWGTLTSYQPQRAALVDKGTTQWEIDNTAGRYLNPVAGHVEVQAVGVASTTPYTGAFLFTGQTDGSFRNRIFLQRGAMASSYHDEGRVVDSGGTIRVQLELPTVDYATEQTYTMAWDSRRKLATGTHAWGRVGGSAQITGPAMPSAGWSADLTAVTAVLPGMRHTKTANCECGLERVRTWGPP